MRAPLVVMSAAALACKLVPAIADEHAATPAEIAPAWNESQSGEILDRTLRLQLPLAEGVLTEAEEAALKELLAAGERMHALYLDQKHPQALAARAWLDGQTDRSDLKDLFELFGGPIATTLDNQRKAFLTVSEETPARNLYPIGTSREELDAFLARNPERRDELLDSRALVRRADPPTIKAALAELD